MGLFNFFKSVNESQPDSFAHLAVPAETGEHLSDEDLKNVEQSKQITTLQERLTYLQNKTDINSEEKLEVAEIENRLYILRDSMVTNKY